MKRRKFIILTSQRTGSTVIALWLNNHPHVRCHSAPWTDTTNWLDYHPRHNSNQERAVGFKIMYSDLRKLRRLERFFYEENISVIHLIRENMVNNYISVVRTRLTAQAHTSGIIKRPEMTLDVKDLMRYIGIKLKQIDVYCHHYKELPYIEVTYEQFLNDLPAFKNQVLDFLEIKAADMAMPPLKRISSGNLHKEITNYNEVEQALSGTPYEKYLLH